MLSYLSRDLVADDVRLRFLMLPGVPPGDSSPPPPPPPPSGVDGRVATSSVSTAAAAGDSGPAGVFSPLADAEAAVWAAEAAAGAAATSEERLSWRRLRLRCPPVNPDCIHPGKCEFHRLTSASNILLCRT